MRRTTSPHAVNSPAWIASALAKNRANRAAAAIARKARREAQDNYAWMSTQLGHPSVCLPSGLHIDARSGHPAQRAYAREWRRLVGVTKARALRRTR